MRTGTKWFVLMVVIGMILAACGQAAPAGGPAASAGATAAPAAPTAAPAATAAAPAAPAATAAASEATAAPAAQPASGEVVEITFWTGPNNPEGGPPPEDWVVYKVLREKLNIDLKLTLLPVGADGETKLNAAAAANELPDLFGLSRNQFYQYVDQDLLGPVDELLPLMPTRTEQSYSDETRNKLVTVDGKLYALQGPALPPNPKRSGLLIRQDWLDKLGLKAPTTLDEFLEVAKAFTEQDPDGNGQNDTFGFGAYIAAGGGNPTLGGQFDFIYGAYGVPGTWNFNDPAKFGANIKDPNYQKATAFIKQLVDAKVIDPDWPTMKLDDFRARWKQGKYGMFFEDFCAAMCKTNYKDFDANNPKGQLVFIDPPKGPDGTSAVTQFSSVGGLLAVSRKAIDAGKGPAIAKFLEWVSSEEGYYLIGFGQEGINYKLDANRDIVTEGVPAPHDVKEQQPILQIKALAYIGSDPELKARYPAFKTSDGRTIEPLEYVKKSQQMPWFDATAGAIIKPASNQADIDRYIREGLVQFALGQRPLDDATWTEFVNGLDGIGFADWEASARQTLQEAGLVK